ncbi:hypothetical protein [Brevundimonas faecalis]|uniref:Helix-turn-helix domain-containing protein n=1 Tax=Brevundimonas faecalis TaxID=947378 RepID=A0ABV2RAS7_9CAUL
MYTEAQMGEPEVRPVTPQAKNPHCLTVIQPDNTQVSVLEPCSWKRGRERTLDLVAKGVDPFDIRFSTLPDGALSFEGLPMRHVEYALWWTDADRISRYGRSSLSHLTLAGVALYGADWPARMARSLGVPEAHINKWFAQGVLPSWVGPAIYEIVLRNRRKLGRTVHTIARRRPRPKDWPEPRQPIGWRSTPQGESAHYDGDAE